MSSTNILSNPTGPRELFTILAIEAAAITVDKKENKIRKTHYSKGQLFQPKESDIQQPLSFSIYKPILIKN